MTENNRNSTNTYLMIAIFFLVGSLVGATFFGKGWFMMNNGEHHNMSMDEHRSEFIEKKEEIIGTLIAKGDYACCLEIPCTYCIEKTPGHGEGAICNCLDDVVNGVHPCGECIGEILEGHGNRFLSPYFAQAIAEEVGEQHLETLKEIIAEKYKQE